MVMRRTRLFTTLILPSAAHEVNLPTPGSNNNRPVGKQLAHASDHERLTPLKVPYKKPKHGWTNQRRGLVPNVNTARSIWRLRA